MQAVLNIILRKCEYNFLEADIESKEKPVYEFYNKL